MKTKLAIIRNLALWAIAPILSSVAFNFNNFAIAETEITEIEEFCAEFPLNGICKKKESYLSLDTWKKNKTKCSLATAWGNEEKKCKVVADDNTLTVYVENGEVAESLPNTLKTEIMTISLDEMFTFDAQWWLADVDIQDMGGDIGTPKQPDENVKNAVGTFPELQIGFVPNIDSSDSFNANFLTISAKSLHQVLEQMEAWRYYLPDMTAFEQKLKPQLKSQKDVQNVSANVAKLKQTGNCAGCDLRNADLTKLDLTNANLAGANLAGANLTQSKLKNAYLLGANLEQASLVDADLETANLIFASLAEADLFEAKLKGANLQNANLSNADLTGAELKAKDLQVTSLKNANLNGVILVDADLRCVNLQSANLKNADLQGVNLSQCKKTKSGNYGRLSLLKLNGVRVSFGIADDIGNVTKMITNIIGAIKNPTTYEFLGIRVSQINFSLASNLSGANLNGANLTNANLSDANLADVNLSNVILADAKLSKNNISNANFINTDVSEVNFKNPILICEAIFSDEVIYEEYCFEEEEGEEE